MEAERVLTAKSFVVDFFQGDAREAMRNPSLYLQRPGGTPLKSKTGVVHATQDDWSHIVRAAWEKGMMTEVSDDKIPRDVGHLIVNQKRRSGMGRRLRYSLS